MCFSIEFGTGRKSFWESSRYRIFVFYVSRKVSFYNPMCFFYDDRKEVLHDSQETKFSMTAEFVRME